MALPILVAGRFAGRLDADRGGPGLAPPRPGRDPLQGVRVHLIRRADWLPGRRNNRCDHLLDFPLLLHPGERTAGRGRFQAAGGDVRRSGRAFGRGDRRSGLHVSGPPEIQVLPAWLWRTAGAAVDSGDRCRCRGVAFAAGRRRRRSGRAGVKYGRRPSARAGHSLCARLVDTHRLVWRVAGRSSLPDRRRGEAQTSRGEDGGRGLTWPDEGRDIFCFLVLQSAGTALWFWLLIGSERSSAW